MKDKTPWCVFDCKDKRVKCRRCGEQLNLLLPQPITIFVAASNAFCKLHKHCRGKEKKKQNG